MSYESIGIAPLQALPRARATSSSQGSLEGHDVRMRAQDEPQGGVSSCKKETVENLELLT